MCVSIWSSNSHSSPALTLKACEHTGLMLSLGDVVTATVNTGYLEDRTLQATDIEPSLWLPASC